MVLNSIYLFHLTEINFKFTKILTSLSKTPPLSPTTIKINMILISSEEKYKKIRLLV